MIRLALPPPTITITNQGESVAEEDYTLICTVSILEDIVENVLLSSTWSNAYGHPLQQNITTIHNATASFMTLLYFSPVYVSHGGQYICNASITVPELSLVKTSSHTYDVIVQCKFKKYHS